MTAAGLAWMTPPTHAAGPRWTPASRATIHPGVRMTSAGQTCTANFVFYDAHAVYLGQPASCTSWTVTKGCSTGAPLGRLVKIEGASRRGTIVYNSLLTTGDACSANNFALVRIHKDDRGRVNPSVPFWGGPTAGVGRSSLGRPVYSYGYDADAHTLSPKFGIDTTSELMSTDFLRPGRSNGGWIYFAHAVTPGMSEHWGGAVLDARGRAFGILTQWAHDTSTRVTDLSRAIRFMKAHTKLDALRLAKGTEPFAPPAVPEA